MRHRNVGRKLGRVRRQRTALLKTLAGSLIMHERIMTTEAKAREVQPFIDQLITKVKRAQARNASVANVIRTVAAQLPLVAARKLASGKFLDRLKHRASGYTRIVKLPPRKSDGALMATILFVDQVSSQDDTEKKTSQKKDTEEKATIA